MSAETTTQSPQSPERFRLNPEFISETLADDERTPERIVEMIQDVDQRRALAQELLERSPELSSQFQDIEALNNRLDMMAEVLPQKKTFFERVKDKIGWAFGKVKSVLSHPVVKTIIIGLLVWWAWGHLHGLLANWHATAAEGALEGLEGLDAAPGALNPGMSPEMGVPGGGVTSPGLGDEFQWGPPSAEPPLPPPGPIT